eukprot:1919553-Amphidinium_carterae.2
MAAPHLLLSINRRWTKADDQALSQIFRYIAGSVCKDMLVGEVARDARNYDDMHVACYADADMAGDSTRTAKSTTGYWVEFVSNGHRFPRAWCSKRQTSTSVSTAETELVAMTSAVKESAIPAQVLPAVAFGKGVPLRMYEDNDACSSIVKSGYSPKLRHLVRTQRTSIGMLSEVLLPEPPKYCALAQQIKRLMLGRNL